MGVPIPRTPILLDGLQNLRPDLKRRCDDFLNRLLHYAFVRGGLALDRATGLPEARCRRQETVGAMNGMVLANRRVAQLTWWPAGQTRAPRHEDLPQERGLRWSHRT